MMDFFFRSDLVLKNSDQPILSKLLADGCELHCEIILECHMGPDITLNGAKVDKFAFHPETHHNSVRARFLMNDLLVTEIGSDADDKARALWEGRYLEEAGYTLDGLQREDYEYRKSRDYKIWEDDYVQGE